MRKCKYITRGLKLDYHKDDGMGYDWDWQHPNKKQKKQRKKYGFDSRECYNLDTTFELWLYAHLKMYLHDASKLINLDDIKYKVTTVRFEDCGEKKKETLNIKNSLIPSITFNTHYKRRIYEEKELTQRECIELMIKYIEKSWKLNEKCIMWLDADDEKQKYLSPDADYAQAAVDIWAKVFNSMWW